MVENKMAAFQVAVVYSDVGCMLIEFRSAFGLCSDIVGGQ